VLSADLDPSLAAVDISATPQQQQPSLENALLVSRGTGDVTLLLRSQGQAGYGFQSEPVYPLRALPPLVGYRPLVIEAAHTSPSGELRCIAWAVKEAAADSGAAAGPGSSARGKAHSPASCETFCVTFRASPLGPAPSNPTAGGAAAASAPGVRLEVGGVQLLRASALPPHLVMADGARDQALLGLDPASCSRDDEDPRLHQAGGQQQHQQQQEEEVHIECRPSGSSGEEAGESASVAVVSSPSLAVPTGMRRE
jgi:hypothetical protein